MSVDVKLEQYLDKVDHLPTLPVVLVQILKKLEDPDFEMNEIVDLILMDQVLTAKTIRMVNSAHFGLNRQVESLRKAVLVLGAKEIRNLVLTTSLLDLFPGNQKTEFTKTFWEHSFASALFSTILAKCVGYKNRERSYLAGLLHDIGEIILIVNFPDEFEKVVQESKNTKYDFHEAEQRVLGISHINFGPLLLEKWSFGGELSHVVSRHHHPETALIDPVLVAIVRLADLFARKNGFGIGNHDKVSVEFENDIAWDILKKKFSNSNGFNPQEIIQTLDDNVVKVDEFISMNYN